MATDHGQRTGDKFDISGKFYFIADLISLGRLNEPD
jgi:hypothetical protein